MHLAKTRRGRWVSLLIPILLVLIPLLAYGSAGAQGSDAPRKISSLLSVEKLKSWIDKGYKDDRGNKVVVLDTSFGPTARSDYDAGHIPGTHHVDFAKELIQTRSDGPLMVQMMVNDGPQMDAHIQRYGIERNTTVVLTGHHIYWMTRAYWTYRYWGFPQSQLFLLNGKATTVNSVWKAAGFKLDTTSPPLPPPSTFSVSSWPGNMDKVRASLEEFLRVAEGKVPTATIIDTRSEAEWNAVVSPTFSNAFAYRFGKAIWRPWELELAGTRLGDPYSAISEAGKGSHVLKPIDQIVAELKTQGITRDKTFYTT